MRSARGMTLVIVLWVVAALTILVAGMVGSQHSELRLAAAARSQVVAVAGGRAAIQMAIQELAASVRPTGRLYRQHVRFGELDIELEVMPLVGLVDLNNAPESLLLALFAYAGQLDEAKARALAASVMARRMGGQGGSGRQSRFEAPEELLSLPGADHDLFARISRLITTDSAGQGRVNPLAAPAEVLVILASGNAELAQRIAGERDAGSVAIDTTRLEGAHIDATASSRYRVTAHVPSPDGFWWEVVLESDVRANQPGGAPWRTLRSSSRRSGKLSPQHAFN